MWFTIDNNLKQHMLKLPKPPCWRESKSAYRLPLHKDGKSRPIPRWSSDMTRNIISCWLRVGSEAMEGKNVMCLKSNAKRNALCVRKESARAMKETEKNAEAKEKADFCFDGASLRGSRSLSLSRQLFMRRRALMCSVPFLSFSFSFFSRLPHHRKTVSTGCFVWNHMFCAFRLRFYYIFTNDSGWMPFLLRRMGKIKKDFYRSAWVNISLKQVRLCLFLFSFFVSKFIRLGLTISICRKAKVNISNSHSITEINDISFCGWQSAEGFSRGVGGDFINLPRNLSLSRACFFFGGSETH